MSETVSPPEISVEGDAICVALSPVQSARRECGGCPPSLPAPPVTAGSPGDACAPVARSGWGKARAVAGKPSLLFHDLRRSTVRNPVSAGVDQPVAMRITGHKTVSVFQRYRIVADDDVRAALERTEAVTKAVPEAERRRRLRRVRGTIRGQTLPAALPAGARLQVLNA